MTTATQSKRTVVGASFSPSDLAALDDQRKLLGGLSRSGALKLLWEHMGDAALQRARAVQAADEANAESAGPLIDALQDLTDAIDERAHQRRAIGVHSNQIARLANSLRGSIERGDLTEVTTAQMDEIALALQRVERRLDAQAEVERGDELLAAEVASVLWPSVLIEGDSA